MTNMGSRFLICCTIEFFIALPALTGGILWLLQRWALRSLRSLTINDWLNAILYPSISMAAGAVAGAGFAEGLDSQGRAGYGWVMGALIVAVLVMSAGTAKMRETAIRVTINPFSRAAWERYLTELDQKVYLSQEDRQWFARRSNQLRQHGRMLCKRADNLQFFDYWKGRPRKVRITAWVLPLIGLLTSVVSAGWIGLPTDLAIPWLVLTLPLGGSMAAAVRAAYEMHRYAVRSDGEDLQRGAALIRERLDLIPAEPRTTVRQRLRRLFI